jgi:putative tricarboxylic transport membrane protein
MDVSGLFSNLALGISVAFSFKNLFWCLSGAIIGTAIGVLPGVGPVATLALLLPVTYHLSPEGALIMLAGIYYGAQYGGSTTAVLVNLPGESSSVVTCIDGYQMARQGRAGPALAIAAIGSFFAGCVATIIIALAAPPLTKVAQQFAAADYFSLMALGLVFDHQGDRHDLPRHAARSGRHRRQHRQHALHLRDPLAVRWHRFRAAGDGCVRYCRDHP